MPHALLLAGKPGVGLATISKNLAGSNLAGFTTPANSKGELDSLAGTISIDVIRDLYSRTRGKQTDRQIYIIDDADRMSRGAQSAFLKLLEEPNENTHFVLTSHAPEALLKTVRSRLQSINIEPVGSQETIKILNSVENIEERKLHQLKFLADGLPAELYRLLKDDSYFEKKAEIMGDTRILLSGKLSEKFVTINKYHQSRAGSLELIDCLISVTKFSLKSKPSKTLINQLDSLINIEAKIKSNHNIRLQLTSFVLQ